MTETLEGTVTFLLRREGQEPAILELELKLPDGTRRMVRTVASTDRPLREGDAVVVTGRTDANQILVADSVTRPAPPPPAPKRAPTWLWLPQPPVALGTMATTILAMFAVALMGLPAPAVFIPLAIALVLVAPLRGASRLRKLTLRVMGTTMALTAVSFAANQLGPLAFVAVGLLLLTVASAVVAWFLPGRSSDGKDAASTPSR